MRVRSIALLVLALALIPASARADWPAGGVLLNGAHTFLDVHLTPDGSGGMLADYVMRYGNGGLTWAGAISAALSGGTAGLTLQSQFGSRPAPDGAGGYFYVETIQVGSDWTYVVRHVGADGLLAPGWPAAGAPITSAAIVSQQTPWPYCASDGSGGVYVLFIQYVNTAATLYLERLDASGAAVAGWPAGGVKIPGVAWPFPFTLTTDATGAAVAIYPYAVSSFSSDISAIRVLPAGSIDRTFGYPLDLGPTGWTTFPQDPPQAVRVGSDIAVAWLDVTPGVNAAWVYRFDATGQSQFVSEALQAPAGSQVQLASDGADGVYVAWRRTSPSVAVEATHLDSQLNPLPGWSSPGVSVLTPAAQPTDGAAAGSDGRGGLMVAWHDVRNGMDSIYVRDLAADGAVPADWPAEGVPLSAEHLGPLAVRGDGAGRAFVAWGQVPVYDFYPLVLSRVEPPGFVSVPAPPAIAGAALRAWPNPARRELHVALARELSGAAQVELIDVSGRLVRRSVLDVRAGAEVRWSLGADVRPGLYVVRAIAAGHTLTTRVAVLH